MGFLFYTTFVIFMFICLILILLILIQKGRGGGLASAFGGGGGNTAFGSKTGDVLTWATSIVFGVFLVVAIALNLLANTSSPRGTAGAPPGAPTPAPSQTEGSIPGPTQPDSSLPKVPPGATDPAVPPKIPTTAP
jgi:preprotein translocase subunit SecG